VHRHTDTPLDLLWAVVLRRFLRHYSLACEVTTLALSNKLYQETEVDFRDVVADNYRGFEVCSMHQKQVGEISEQPDNCMNKAVFSM
jgi:hypothetical protein